jgi:hypothetical protein
MRVREVQLLGRKGENSGGFSGGEPTPARQPQQQQPSTPVGMDAGVADDLPF